MAVRRRRSLILPLHPRRNRCSPMYETLWEGNALPKGTFTCYLWNGSASFSGSGYVSPWVSTVTEAMT